MKLFAFFFMFLGGMMPHLSASFFERHAEGWHWYQDPPTSEKTTDPQRQKPGLSLAKPLTASEAIKSQRQALEESLNEAIIHPTSENIEKYIVLQRRLLDQSGKFANEWQRVVMRHPELDESLQNPVDQNALQVLAAEKNKATASRMEALSREYGLFFFFKGECPYCHGVAPIVKNFAQKYDWDVLAISLDGGKLKEFPQARNDNGIARNIGIAHVPALMAIHPQTGALLPLAYGMISESEIERRVMLLTQPAGEHP